MIVARLLQFAVAPGVVAHEFAHWLACKLTGTRVHEVCWFQFGDPAGYVVHDRAASASAGALIGFAPTLVNTALAAMVSYRPAFKLLSGAPWLWVDAALAWLGFVVALRAFPSRADAKAMWEAARAARFGWLKALMVGPLWLLAQILALGSKLWLDVVFALIVCFAAPALKLASEGRLRWPF